MPIEIEPVQGPTTEARLLVEELESELSSHYAAEQRHGLAFEAIFQPHIRFFLARRDGMAEGCGGIALYPGFGEVKRMYVRPMARGHGIADEIVARLAQEARAEGLALLRLETGVHQKAAIRFYQRCGFRNCGHFEPYSSMSADSILTSVFMERSLD